MKKKGLLLVFAIIIGITGLVGCTLKNITQAKASGNSKDIAIVNVKGNYIEYEIDDFGTYENTVSLHLKDGSIITTHMSNVVIMPERLLKE